MMSVHEDNALCEVCRSGRLKQLERQVAVGESMADGGAEHVQLAQASMGQQYWATASEGEFRALICCCSNTGLR